MASSPNLVVDADNADDPCLVIDEEIAADHNIAIGETDPEFIPNRGGTYTVRWIRFS